jgi:hypothetical protein
MLAGRRSSVPRTLLLVAAGAAIPLALVALIYLAAGALDDLWYANYTYNRLYLDASGRRAVLPADKHEIVALVGAALLMALVAVSVRRQHRVLVLTLSTWLAGAAVGAQLSGWAFPHYYAPLVVPACALLCMPVVPTGWAARSRRALAATGLALIVVLVVAAPFARSVARTFGKTGSELAVETYGPQAKPWTAAFAVGDEVRRRSRPGDRMFVLGSEPEFYWTSDVKPASYYIYDLPRAIDPRRYLSRVQRDLCKRPPRWLVEPRGTAPPPSCLARLDYRPATRDFGVDVLELAP